MAFDEIALLSEIEFFKGLNNDSLQAISRLCELVTVSPKDRVCRTGEPAGGLYFILDGSVRLINDHDPNRPVLIDTLYEGAHFGEDSLLSDISDRFSVYGNAVSSTLLQLPKDRFQDFIESHPHIDAVIKENMAHHVMRVFLSRSAIFKHVPDNRLTRLIRSLDTRKLSLGSFLIRQGEKGKEAYIVKQGRFRIYSDDAPKKTVAIVNPGDLVGEIALVKDVRRTMNVVAQTESMVLVISKKDFMGLMSEQEELSDIIDHLIDRRVEEDEAARKNEMDAEAAQSASNVVPPIVAENYKRPFKDRLKRFPAVRQQSTMDCGAACLATVCRFYGKHVSLNRLRELARVGKAGASMLNLMRAANELGFETVPVLSTIDHLSASHLPAVVNWNGYHWIVVYKIDRHNIYVADPAEGLTKMSRDAFIEGWTRYTLFLLPTEKIDAIEESKPTFKQFDAYVKPHRRLIYEIGLASLVIQILNMFMPLFTKFVIDDVVIKQDQRWLQYSMLGISCLIVVSLMVNFCRNNLLLSVSFKISLLMASDFYRKVLSLPLPYFENRKVGDITSRFQENEKITDFFTNTGVQIFLDMFTAVIYLGLMFYFNVTLAFVACAILSLNIFVVYYITPRLQHAYRESFQKGADSESFLIESLKGWTTIKTLGIEHLARWMWENLYVGFTNVYFKTIKYGMVSSVFSGLVNHVGDVAVLFIGALMVLKGSLTIGALVAFTVLVKNVSAPINTLVGAWDTFQEALNSVERMNDVLDAEPETTDRQSRVNVPRLRGHVKFENVTFRYEPEAKTNVLQNINLEIQPGRRVAFVGRSGSGKSTLIKLLLGFYQPTSGDIYVDGFNLKDVWPPSLRRQIGVVPQHSYLFKGRIRENIARANPNASAKAVIEAARLADAHDFITSFPDEYRSMLEEQGSNLSGGQRQRICIARMFLQQPHLLILDEATSALDNESERFIQHNIETVFQDRTVFMIAHRLSTIRNCDLIVVIDKGNVIEQGTHEQLMDQKGLYYFLNTQQLNL